jgi:UDP-glucose 4-epimerase
MSLPTDPDGAPTVAVTGAAGFIGSRVIRRLQHAHPDWRLTALDNFYHGDLRAVGDCPVRRLDVRDRDELDDALSGADVVLHLAAISGVDDCESEPDLAYEVNVTGTSNVAWFCRRHGAGMVFPFSMAVLGDPERFPITADQPREPLNWYGRTKLLGEQLVEGMASKSFPAHLFMKSNLYGEHRVGEATVSKGTVINFFVNRATNGDSLTVYEPGTQSRNFVHVDDVARAYVSSAERLLTQLDAGETGVETYEIASDEAPSIMTVAETVRRVAAEERDVDVSVSLIENPRGNETLVDGFDVDTSRAREMLDWTPSHTIEESIRTLVREKTFRSSPQDR